MTFQVGADPDFSDYLGRSLGPYYGFDTVNMLHCRHWAEVMGDANFIQSSSTHAVETSQHDLEAPPAMLQVWTMRSRDGSYGPGSSEDDPRAIFHYLDSLGYDGVVAVNCKQQYLSPILIGDRVSHFSKILSVSDPKKTRLGKGYFVTEVRKYFVNDKKLVGTMHFRVLKYRSIVSRD